MRRGGGGEIQGVRGAGGGGVREEVGWLRVRDEGLGTRYEGCGSRRIEDGEMRFEGCGVRVH